MTMTPFSEFEKMATRGNVVPVVATCLADMLTPVSAFLRLRQNARQAFLLESVEGPEKIARFSFLGADPFMTIKMVDGKVVRDTGGSQEVHDENIFEHLKKLFAEFRTVRPPNLPRFCGGAIGYFGFETIRYLENVPVAASENPAVPEALVMLCDIVLAFDQRSHQLYIIKNAFVDHFDSLSQAYTDAIDRIETTRKTVLQATGTSLPHSTGKNKRAAPLRPNFTKEAFCAAVERAKEYIVAGDIFQVVLSQRFTREVSASPFDIYRALRVINPSPYLYYLQFGELAIIGASPELMVRVEDRCVEVRPIAGTRPRGADEASDARLATELQQDEKEVAEHVMLLDLGRNDVGRVSQYGSVDVTEYMNIERYSHVMHLVSNVRGMLQPHLTTVDALTACFPAGTVSGAPKIRAIEIISELEPEARGVYSGALGYLDFAGNLDTCIAIRTLVMQGQTATFQAGAGIVADSVPEREFQETLDKAKAVRTAIDFAEQELT